MKTLETNDWIILNTIIYKVYTMEDFDEMRKELLEQLKLLVDFDSADFYLASVEDEKKLDRPVMYNCDSNLSEEYEELDYSRGIMLSGKSLIYRETDIISDESRVEMEYYKKVYKPNNWHYSLQVVIAKDHHFLGTITFYRTIGKENFKYDDIFVLDMLKDHLANRMEKHQRRVGEEGEKLTVTQAVEQYGLTRREDTILRNLMLFHPIGQMVFEHIENKNVIVFKIFLSNGAIKRNLPRK